MNGMGPAGERPNGNVLDIGGHSVPRIGFGTLRLPADRDSAVRLLHRAYELGVRLFDTADVYGPETAEEAVASAFHPYPADLLVATKGGASPRRGPSWMADGSPAYLRRACEASLRRLRLDTIDLYQLHWPDPNVPIQESVGGLADLMREGKIRHIGLSNVSAAQLAAARAVAPIVGVQNRFSVAGPDDDEVLNLCTNAGIAYLPWYPLGCGSLARDAGPLGRVAERHSATPAQVALAWLLHHSPFVCVIPGTGSLAHLEENVAAGTIDLTDDDQRELAAVRVGSR
jgi:pyridoxine 4-dehydrogenase